MTAMALDEVTVLFVSDRSTPPSYLADLARSGRYRPVGRGASVASALDPLGSFPPDVVLCEVTGFRQVHDLTAAAARLQDAAVVVVSDLPAEQALLLCLAAGVRGFVGTPVAPGVLDHAVSAVLAGHAYVDPAGTAWLVEFALRGHRPEFRSGLTVRQAQVLQLVRGGLTNREIAAALGVSLETVKTHLHEAMRRLGTHDRWAATTLADGALVGEQCDLSTRPTRGGLR